MIRTEKGGVFLLCEEGNKYFGREDLYYYPELKFQAFVQHFVLLNNHTRIKVTGFV